jgi:hypothetical protein
MGWKKFAFLAGITAFKSVRNPRMNIQDEMVHAAVLMECA